MPIEVDPKILESALTLFKERGYYNTELSDIATRAEIPLPAVQSHFAEKDALLKALLTYYTPKSELQIALSQIRTDTGAGMVRDAMRRTLNILNDTPEFLDLAMIDVQVNGGSYISKLFGALTSEGVSFITRLSAMPNMRPVSSIMLGRAFVSLIIGFAMSERMAPEGAQFAMRVVPEEAWIDGMSDILLYGIMHENAD